MDQEVDTILDMPDEAQGDVFLRHRSVVLAALVPGSSGPNPEPELPEPVPVGSTAIPLDAAQRLVAEAETVPEPRRPAGAGSHDPVRPRSSRRSSASEQINALLNGSGPLERRVPDFADSPRMSPNGPDPETPQEQSPEPGGKDRFDDLLRRRSGGRLGEWAQRIAPRLREPKVLLSVGAVLAVLLLVILLTTGGESERKEQPLVLTSAVPTPAEPTEEASRARPIEVASATSHCPPGSTNGMDALSGEAGKAWSCVRAYRVDGQVLTIDLGGTYTVESISIVPGWDHIRADGVDEWTRHRTASRVSYQFDNENYTTYTQETLDQRGVVTTEINPPVSASKITLTILESSGDRSLNDTAVSSIVITGKKDG